MTEEPTINELFNAIGFKRTPFDIDGIDVYTTASPNIYGIRPHGSATEMSVYLGDGITALAEGATIKLRLCGSEGCVEIVLEPQVLEALYRFKEHLGL